MAETFVAAADNRNGFHAGSSVMIPASAEGLFWTPTRPGRSATLLCVRLGMV